MKKIISLVVVLALIFSLSPYVFADITSKVDKTSIYVSVGDEWKTVKAFQASYENNIYVSMRSLAEAFAGSSLPFNFENMYTVYDGSYFAVETGIPYTPVECNDEAIPGYITLSRNRIFKDGQEMKYFTFLFGDPADLYISIMDFCMLMNINASGDSNAVVFDLSSAFSPDIYSMSKAGFFDSVSSVLLGNTEVGDIMFSKNIDNRYPVASITKLMTYLVVMDTVSTGRISLDTQVPISENVVFLSHGENGLIEMTSDKSPSVNELLNTMLVASSNESALALAELCYGSEASFTTQMNRKARELGLTDSRFYNCSGLPFYTKSLYPTKLQNFMSSNDIFKLVQAILTTYPSITEITSQMYYLSTTFEYNTANSNSLVFNLTSVNGLKTGNTNLAGSCIVCTDVRGNIVIVLGAEDNCVRGRTAEVLLRAIR